VLGSREVSRSALGEVSRSALAVQAAPSFKCPGWQDLARKWDIGYFLLKPGRFRGLHLALQRSGWTPAYLDPDCAVYLSK
jgi:hypothetical protein